MLYKLTMDVERIENDYYVNLTREEVHTLCGLPSDETPLPLIAPVRGPVKEVFSITRDPDKIRSSKRAIDHILFERGEHGPEVTVDRHAVFGLMFHGHIPFVTRYDGDNKIWIKGPQSKSP